MSERFLVGYAIDLAKLRAMLGTAKLAPKAIRARAKQAVVRDIDMTLGDGDRKAGRLRVDAALDQLVTKKLGEAYDLRRATQLVVDAYGKALGTAEVPFIDGDSFGLMNPVFKALKMPTLAKLYGKSPLRFSSKPFLSKPFPSKPFPSKSFQTKPPEDPGWPIAMAIEGTALASCAEELATKWPRDVAGLADKVFTNKQYGTSLESIDYQKQELVPVLAHMAKWTAAAVKAKQALVMYLDGDR